MKKTVLVFGTFDGLHPGHDFFLRQAKKHGDALVVCLARPAVVAKLKGRAPRYSEKERQETLRRHQSVDHVILGDKKLGRYSIIDSIRPAVIVLGYDQKDLQDDLGKWLRQQRLSIKIKVVGAYRPEQFKSSLLRSTLCLI